MNELKRKIPVKNIGMLLISLAWIISACSANNKKGTMTHTESNDESKAVVDNMGPKDTATFANGCFWCTEAVFQQLKGVIQVTSGYSGGHVENPTYKEVCNGTTGHAECLQIIFDPTAISFDELLEVFWQTHDPTTLNRQGNDVGPQYRSAVFYHDQEQKEKAEKYKEELNKNGAFDKPIVTEISPLINFYKAENYHQNYYNNNEMVPYCYLVIRPKLEKFEKVFKNKLKK